MAHGREKRLFCLLIAALIIAQAFGFGCIEKDDDKTVVEATASAAVFVTPEPMPTPNATALPSAEPTPEPTPTPAPPPTVDELIDAYIAGMSTEAKLGQLVMFGFGGKRGVDKEFTTIADEYLIGNIIFYGNNVDREDGSGGFDTMAGLVRLLNENEPAGIPRLYSIDIEGGSVHRFIWQRELYSARALGGLTPEAAYTQFEYVGESLREIGINLDLAPVLDIAPRPMDTFLGSRIISADAEKAAEIGSAIIEGLHAGNCLATAKHFPGHGGTNDDSHQVTPVVYSSEERLRSYDLLPFAAGVEAGVDCVLVAHISYPALDENDIASMSPVIIEGLLRGELGFDGVVISDDFRMQGLTNRYPAEDAAVRFILAGGDIILCGATYSVQRQIMESLKNAAEDGTLSAERIDLSVHRVLYAKYKAGIWEPPAAD